MSGASQLFIRTYQARVPLVLSLTEEIRRYVRDSETLFDNCLPVTRFTWRAFPAVLDTCTRSRTQCGEHHSLCKKAGILSRLRAAQHRIRRSIPCRAKRRFSPKRPHKRWSHLASYLKGIVFRRPRSVAHHTPSPNAEVTNVVVSLFQHLCIAHKHILF